MPGENDNKMKVVLCRKKLCCKCFLPTQEHSKVHTGWPVERVCKSIIDLTLVKKDILRDLCDARVGAGFEMKLEEAWMRRCVEDRRENK